MNHGWGCVNTVDIIPVAPAPKYCGVLTSLLLIKYWCIHDDLSISAQMARIRRLISGREKRVSVHTALTAELIPADKIGTITFVVITVHCTCEALLRGRQRRVSSWPWSRTSKSVKAAGWRTANFSHFFGYFLAIMSDRDDNYGGWGLGVGVVGGWVGSSHYYILLHGNFNCLMHPILPNHPAHLGLPPHLTSLPHPRLPTIPLFVPLSATSFTTKFRTRN